MIDQIIAFDKVIASMLTMPHNLLIRGFSLSAYTIVIIVCLFYIYHYFKFKKHKEIAFWLPLSSIILFLCVRIIKILVERVRPNGELYSFPSGHTTMAFFIAFMLPVEKEGKLVLFIWASLIGLSRLLLVEHWLSDVLVGAGIGLVAGWLVKKKITSS